MTWGNVLPWKCYPRNGSSSMFQIFSHGKLIHLNVVPSGVRIIGRVRADTTMGEKHTNQTTWMHHTTFQHLVCSKLSHTYAFNHCMMGLTKVLARDLRLSCCSTLYLWIGVLDTMFRRLEGGLMWLGISHVCPFPSVASSQFYMEVS